MTDPSSIGMQLGFLVVLLMLSAFFSSSETSLMSYNKIKMKYLADNGDSKAKRVNELTKDSGKLLSVILIGNNLVNIAASAIATSLAIAIVGNKGVPIATFIMTVLVIIFAEITPKTVATRKAEKIALMVSKPISMISVVLKPIVFIFNFVSNTIVKILGVNIDIDSPSITEEELKTIVDVGNQEGVFEQEEKDMIYNVFDFADLHAKDIMTPRIDIIAIDVNSSFDEVINTFKQEQFSRMPVYEDNIDNIIGILNIKDLFLEKASDENFDIRKFMRPAEFTFEFKMADELFKDINKHRNHMVIVVDEYGGTSGLVTVEDLIEELVGEIEDEYDDYEQEIEKVSETEYIVNGSTKIDDVNETLNINLVSDEYDSIGGFMIGELGHIPKELEEVKSDNIVVKAEDIDKNRVKKVRIFVEALES